MADSADTADTGAVPGAPVGALLSARAAAAVLGISERTVRRAIGRGELRATKYAGTYRVAPSDLALYRRQISGPAPSSEAALGRQAPARLNPTMFRCPPLPAPMTPLVGRHSEVAAVSAWLRAPGVRLVTLTGPGGVGKTRVAIQVAAGFMSQPPSDAEFADGVCFVPLAALADASLVAATIASILGIREESDRALATTLAERLRMRQMLLVLDNFEQLTAAAPLVVSLLVACPKLRILTTSRAILRLSGERCFPVPPLTLPDRVRLPSPDEIGRYEAVSLFVERARDVSPTFCVTSENAASLAAICSELDGLPLAIELAARWSNLFTPQALLDRLGRRLPLLADGARDQPPRLQTMRNAIVWSYDLLTPSEQVVFRRLAVFVGGWSLEAAAAVAGDDGIDVFATLASLVDQSLVRRLDDGAGESLPRFGMLETIREFALERLEASGEGEAIRRRLAVHLLAFAKCAEQKWYGPSQLAWLERLETELDNIRAALSWATDRVHDEGETGLALASTLWGFWQTRHLVEGRDRLERILSETAGLDVAEFSRGKALWAAGLLAFDQGDDEAAIARHEASLAIAHAGGDSEGAARALFYLALIALRQGKTDRGAAHAEEAHAFALRTDTWFWVMAAEFALGVVARIQGDHARAIALLEGCLARGRAQGHLWTVAWSLNHLADATRDAGDVDGAIRLRRECLGLFAAHGDPIWAAAGLTDLATLLVGRIPAERAARILGAAEALRDELRVPVLPPARPAYDRAIAAVRAELAGDFDAAWGAGRADSAAQAIAEAMTADAPVVGARSACDPRPAATNPGLTPRELDVLRLLGEGRSNRDIGEALFLSHRTVQVHVGNILAKLGVETRAAAVAQAHRRGIV